MIYDCEATVMSEFQKQQQSIPPTDPQSKKKKSLKGLKIVACVEAVLILCLGVFFAFRYFGRTEEEPSEQEKTVITELNQTVMTVSGYDISVKQFNHYFVEIANRVGSYASYMGIDPTVPIDEQKVSADSYGMLLLLGLDTECLEPYKPEVGSYDITWAGYFALLAKETAAEAWSLYAVAMNDPNYTVPAEVENSIKEEMDSLDAVAKEFNIDADEYVEYYYGKGCNEETYETFIRTRYIASDYVNNYRFGAEDIDSRYAEAQADFDAVTFLCYTVKASWFSSDETYAEGEDAKWAKAMAEAMEASFDEEDDEVYVYADYNRETTEDYITEEAASWLFETAHIGDVKLFANEDGTTYYVLKLVANDVNYPTSNFLQIFISWDWEDTTITDGGITAYLVEPGDISFGTTGIESTGEELSEEEHVHVEGGEHADEDMTAAEKVEAILAALKENSSEENFCALSDTYNSQPDSLELEDTSYAYLANYVSKESFNWSFAGLKAGDYQVFENPNGTYILFYLGTSGTYRNLSVNAKLVTEMVENLTKEALDNCNFNMDAAMKGSVSLVMSTGDAYTSDNISDIRVIPMN